MKPVVRYRTPTVTMFRGRSKQGRVLRIKPVKLRFTFRPVRFGVKPEIHILETDST